MDIALQVSTIENVSADVAVVIGFERPRKESVPLAESKSDTQSWSGRIEDLYLSGEFKGAAYESVLIHFPPGLRARRLLMLGAGKPEQFGPALLRRLAGVAVRTVKPKQLHEIALVLSAEHATPENVAAVTEGSLIGNWEPDQHRTEKKPEAYISTVNIVVPSEDTRLQNAVERGRIFGEAQNLTRDLVNEPANRLTPRVMAERAQQMAAQTGIDCEILSEAQMREMGMGALIGVAQGSAERPVLIVLRYKPHTRMPTGDHLALIGKGVTFDTGGISIKPSEGMEKMKYDMAGGAAVIGAMSAIAQLKPDLQVTALIPAVENMPGSKAQRPGDIVTTLNGKTVEVLNTDAEGRLILADAMTYAIRQGCTHLVDAATLTGAIVVALAHVNVGVFTNDQALLDRLLTAAKQQGEKMWHMPLDEDYREMLKSPFADLPNISGGRWGGAVTAAAFLQAFTEDKPWVHLDIAGTAWIEDQKPYIARGPSGVAVRTFAHMATNWVEKA